MSDYLFVYGTLRRGFNHPMAAQLERLADFVGVGSYQGRLYDLGSYPGVIPSTCADEWVVGDVYRLKTHRALRRFDHYEEYDPRFPEQSLYIRELASIKLADRTQHAWVYRFNQPVLSTYRYIASGDYFLYIHR